MVETLSTEETPSPQESPALQPDMAMVKSEVVSLANTSPALRMVAFGMVVAQQAHLDRLAEYDQALVAERANDDQLRASLLYNRKSPNMRRKLERHIRRTDAERQKVAAAILALEMGFIPIPYLDHEIYHAWNTRHVPFPVLKYIKEHRLEQLFDELGIVLPQDTTFHRMTFREPAPNNETRETTVMGRSISSQLTSTKTDPLLIGSLTIAGRRKWFLLAIWGNALVDP